MNSDDPFYNELIAVESIPPLPGAAAELLALATDPDVDIAKLAEVIERDPPLTARLIGIANSAFYAPRQPVVTVKNAIVSVLGLDMVRNMSLGMALAGGFSNNGCPSFDLTEYWIMALGTADLASGLARAATVADAPDPDVTYLVGLLHNLGLLLLVHVRPKDMEQALKLAGDKPGTRLIEHERDLIGTDHWAAGAFLCRHWQLPAVVADCIEQLDDTVLVDRHARLVELLRSTRRWLLTVIAGRPDVLRATSVDDVYTDYRSQQFLDRYDALKMLARFLGGEGAKG